MKKSVTSVSKSQPYSPLPFQNDDGRLLNITNAVIARKTKWEALAVLRNEIMELVPFHSIAFLIVDEDGLHHYNMSLHADEGDDAVRNHLLRLDKGLEKWVHPGSYLEALIKDLETAQCPLVIDLETVYKKWDEPFISILKKTSCQEALAGLLQTREKIFGCLWLNGLQKKQFSKNKFPLFEAISKQVSVALMNVMAIEEAAKKLQEKESLYKISAAIANVNNRNSLLRFAFNELKEIFQFFSISILIIDKDGNTCTDWTAREPNFFPSEFNMSLHNKGLIQVPYKNSLQEVSVKAQQAKGCPIVNKITDDLAENYQDMNPTFDLIFELGIKEMLFTTLKCQDKILGLINMSFVKPKILNQSELDFFQVIADQLALAISNIIYTEEIVSNATEIKRLNKKLTAQNNYLIEEVEQQYNFDDMIGQSQPFRELCKSIVDVAKTESSVLLLGETGTGKELVARAIHNSSLRKEKKLIKLNCAALPANLIESELFGHERGAFTGAFDKRIGKFELAHGSTLFLDEIGEMPIDLQAKLLRALQEKEIERLGSNKTIKVDVRIIAATNRNLLKEIDAGRFRQDLYYRLFIFPITIPPLRKRKEDLILLATHFLQKLGKKLGKKTEGLSQKAMQQMMAYHWPGNIREMEHVMERCIILSKTKLIQDLNIAAPIPEHNAESKHKLVLKTWEQQERDYIIEVLKHTNNNVSGRGGAAELLDLRPTTLQSKMKKLGIKKGHFLEGG